MLQQLQPLSILSFQSPVKKINKTIKTLINQIFANKKSPKKQE
jgi:hypothetical protein